MMIPVSEKHGINPTIPICFFCGKAKNEIAVLGRLKGDVEAPMHCVINYEPCDEYYAEWSRGVPILEIRDTPMAPSQPKLGPGYPTGHYIVIRQEALNDPERFPIGRPIVMFEKEFRDLLPKQEETEGKE